jgi:hypothetical protein
MISRTPAVVAALVCLFVMATEVAGVAPTGFPGSAEPAWAFKWCQIGRDRTIEITHAPLLTCAQAKRVLFRLKGHRDTVPMACNYARTVLGWRITITPASKSYDAMSSTYRRGRYSFQYIRPSTPRHSCDPKYPDEPDA